ncbi:MAG: TMAO reductase system periplasmic protein TorT [Hyphomicrobiales bacterium]|nr:MAG: TMAO reductase system periplasmic protein TorT [Hyphomicrobiales bacterium]
MATASTRTVRTVIKAKTLRNCLPKRARRASGFFAYARILAICAVAAFLMPMSPVAAQDTGAPAAARICVIVPHFKDEYWLSVGFGLHTAAEETGAELLTYESGGYHSLERQIELLDICRAEGAQAILLGAVSADDARLIQAVVETEKHVPVLALVNALDAPGLAGWVGVDWRKMGLAVGAFLSSRHPKGSEPVRAVLVTGPTESGWGPILDSGLAEGLKNSSLNIVETYRADTGLREQLRQVERALAEYPDADYLIGSAPAVEGAMALLRRHGNDTRAPRLLATYISHSVLRGLKRGQVEMVPFDDPIAQGRLGLKLALRSIEGERFPGLSGPRTIAVEAGSRTIDRIGLSPSAFFPELE